MSVAVMVGAEHRAEHTAHNSWSSCQHSKQPSSGKSISAVAACGCNSRVGDSLWWLAKSHIGDPARIISGTPAIKYGTCFNLRRIPNTRNSECNSVFIIFASGRKRRVCCRRLGGGKFLGVVFWWCWCSASTKSLERTGKRRGRQVHNGYFLSNIPKRHS